jgi:RHS repeat-associated protein
MNRLLSQQPGGNVRFAGTVDEPAGVTVQGQSVPVQSDGRFEGTASVPPGTSQVTVTATDLGQTTRTNIYEMQGITGATASYQYDPNGNLIQKTEGTDVWAYEWNANNELTRVTKNGVEQARFAYDPLGRRVEKVAGGVTSSYVYDKTSILREVRGSATLKYVHGLGVDEPLAVDDGAGLSYFHIDPLGSVAKLTNASGTVTLTRKYDAWGNLEVGTSEPGYAFTGREWDPEVGLYYYRARYYGPTVGRFVSEDPIKFEDGTNTYTYVRGNPVLWTDPTGLFTTWPERWACLGDLDACSAKWNCVGRAERMTERVFRTDVDGTRANAFLHCFWACCTSKKVGPCRTEKQLTPHENYTGNPPQDMHMDLYNNYQGAGGAAAFPDRGCRSICLAAPARFYK